MEWMKFFQEQINVIVGAGLAAVGTAIAVFFKKIPNLIRYNYRKNNILIELKKRSKAISITQDLVDDLGAIYGHGILYHNHGPQKLTVIYEVIGHPCKVCVKQCKNYNDIQRLQEYWVDRPIHGYWLNNLCLKTLKLNGKINTATYRDADKFQKQIWDQVGTNTVKEILVRVNDSNSFTTLVVSFCKRFERFEGVDVKMINISNQLKKLL